MIAPSNLKQMLHQTVFTTRIRKFFNNAKGKIGKQRIHNRLKLMEEIKDAWLGVNLTAGAIKTLLKKALFQYRY